MRIWLYVLSPATPQRPQKDPLARYSIIGYIEKTTLNEKEKSMTGYENALTDFETAVTTMVNEVGPATPAGWVTTTATLETLVKQLARQLVEAGREDVLVHLTKTLTK
jgi:hypothetical protein